MTATQRKVALLKTEDRKSAIGKSIGALGSNPVKNKNVRDLRPASRTG